MNMVSKTAVDYVKTQLQSGFKPDEIKKAMKKAGWKEADIDAAIATAYAPQPEPVEETVAEGQKKPSGPQKTPATIELPANEYESDIYSAAMAIGKILPALDTEETESMLDQLHEIADKHGFLKFAGLIETLKLTVEGEELEQMRVEIARVGPRIREVFEEELRKQKRQGKKK